MGVPPAMLFRNQLLPFDLRDSEMAFARLPSHRLAILSLLCMMHCGSSMVRAEEGKPSAVAQATAEPSAEELQFFETRIRPLLAEHCYECHSGEARKGELSFDSRSSCLKVVKADQRLWSATRTQACSFKPFGTRGLRCLRSASSPKNK